MPQPIYMNKRVNPLQRYLPYALQLGLNMQRQGAARKQAEAQAKLRPQEMTIGGRKGVYNPANQSWTEFKPIDKGWSKMITAKENDGSLLPPGTVYQTGPKGKVNKLFEPKEPKKPFKVGALKSFKIGEQFVGGRYTGNPKDNIRGKYPGWTEESTAKRHKPTTNITNIMPSERFGLQKSALAGDIRANILGNSKDKLIYESKVQNFNNANTRNEVIYWDSTPKTFNRKGQSKVIKLTKKQMAEGWSPSEIQRVADETGQTIEQVLKDVRVIK